MVTQKRRSESKEWDHSVSVVISKETLHYLFQLTFPQGGLAPLWVHSTVRKTDDCEVLDPSQSRNW